MKFFPKHLTNAEGMFHTIYDAYSIRVFDYIKGKVKDRDDICDIMQNVFFHLWLYKESLESTNIENIIFKTCNQEISNFFVLKQKQPLKIEHSYREPQDYAVDQLLAAFEKESQLNTLEERIELLPLKRKQIFKMNKLEGFTQEKIANRLNLSKKAVKKQIAKALLFLRDQGYNS